MNAARFLSTTILEPQHMNLNVIKTLIVSVNTLKNVVESLRLKIPSHSITKKSSLDSFSYLCDFILSSLLLTHV